MAFYARKQWKLASLAVLGLAGALTFAYAYQSIYNGIKVTEQLDCPYEGPNPGDIEILALGQVHRGTTSGTGKYEVTFVSDESDPNHQVKLKPVSIEATSKFPGLGTVTTKLDDATPVEESKVEGLVPGQDFPAKIKIAFNAKATTDAGVEYKSKGPVVFKADNATSFNKFVNEPFTLEAPVDFVAEDGSKFTLTKLDSKFN